jgi:two-component sensor histidine kinase
MTSLATVLPRSGDPGLAEECPAYKSAVSADMLRPRASRFMTEDACHLPPRRVRLEGPPVSLEPSVAQALAIALHELATNAAKYGCLSQATGHLDLTWHRTDGRLTIRWMEMDGPTVQKPTHRGFGTRVIKQMIGQVDGEAQFDWAAPGLICEITIPIRES